MPKKTPPASGQKSQKQSDPAYKQFFSSKGMVQSLLQTLIPKNFVTQLDLNTLEPCKAAYVSDKRYKQFFDDIVWRANWKEGGYCYLYLVFEFQSRNEWYMAVRMLVYTAMLYLELIRSGQIKSGDKLPLVFPLVIYNNAPKWSAKLRIQDLYGAIPAELKPYQPTQQYFVLELRQIAEELLKSPKSRKSAAAYLARMEQAATAQNMLSVITDMKQYFTSPKLTDLRRLLFLWADHIMDRMTGQRAQIAELNDPEEMGIMLEDNFRMIFEELELKGRLAASTATATRLKALGDYSDAQIAEITALPLSKVRAIGRKPRTAASRTRSTKAAPTARRSRKAVPSGV